MASQNSQTRRSLRNSLPIVHENLVADTDVDGVAEASIPRVQSPAHLSPPKHHRVRVIAEESSSGGSCSKSGARRSSTCGPPRGPNGHDRRFRTQRHTGQLYSHQQSNSPHIAFQYSRPWIAYIGSNDSTEHDLEKQRTHESDASRQSWAFRHGGWTRIILVVFVLIIIVTALAVGLSVGLRRS